MRKMSVLRFAMLCCVLGLGKYDILTAPPPPVPKCLTPIQFGPPIAAAGTPGTGASNGRCAGSGAGTTGGLPRGLIIAPITVGGRGAGGAKGIGGAYGMARLSAYLVLEVGDCVSGNCWKMSMVW